SPRRSSRARARRRPRRGAGSRRTARTRPRRGRYRRFGAASARLRTSSPSLRTLSSEAMAGLRIERDGDVLRVTLAKPERRNAFDAALIAELHEAFSDIGDARVVVLAGDGPSFCAGADVEWQRSSIDLSFEENVEDAL